MKTLLLMRHAKSSWQEEGIADAERPLTDRGNRDALHAGKILIDRATMPDVIIASSALRTSETAQLVSHSLGNRLRMAIVIEAALYAASADVILSVVNSMTGDHRCALLIGHNPGMQEAAYRLTGEPVSFKTATIACVDFEAKSWADVDYGDGALRWLTSARADK